MKIINQTKKPKDFKYRQSKKPIICYPKPNHYNLNLKLLQSLRTDLILNNEIIISPRDAKTFRVKKGDFFRIECIDGPQVGDLNLFNALNLEEKFYSGKTRALYGTHLSTGDQMLSSFPYLRPLTTITYDTLDWYGFDKYGASVHDVIGTRCDPYTSKLLNGNDYDFCCHSNLIRALFNEQNISIKKAELLVHDVLNVFMCTGFTRDTHEYFMKASPVRPGDYLEFFANIDLLGVLSSCPGGDCSIEHSSDHSKCFPLKISVFSSNKLNADEISFAPVSSYNQNHGLK